MLDTIKIAELIENPSLVESSHLDSLKELSEKYPYSPIFSQLYLKGLSVFNPILFEDQLKEHAYRIPDRAQLYGMIHFASEQEPKEVVQVSSNEDSRKEVSLTEPELETIPDEDETNSAISEDLVLEITPEPEEAVIEEIENTHVSNDTDVEIHLENTESKENQVLAKEDGADVKDEPKQKADDLDREILSHAISSSISYEVDSEFTDEETFKIDYSKLNTLDKNSEKTAPIDIEFETKLEIRLDEDTSKSKDSDFVNQKKSFLEWMQPSISKVEKHEPDIEKEKESEKRSLVKEKIKELSTFAKPRQEFFSPVKKAKESLDESRLPVSETLAKIYGAQGNYPKAIEAYEKLMFKFPEKKSFFALQIESLKRKLN